MFDTVGSAVDRDSDRRRLVVGAVTTGVAGALFVAASTWVAQHVVAAPPVIETVDDMLVELADDPLPGPPELPPGGGGGGGAADDAPQATEPVTAAPEPSDAPSALPPSTLEPVAVSDGPGGCASESCGEGPGPGTGSGVGPGVGPGDDGDGGGGARTVRSEDLRWRRRVDPRFPAAAREQGVEGGRCVTTVSFDGSGRPTDVEILGCAAVFHDAVRDAMFSSRVYAPQAAPQRARIVFQFDLVPASNP